MVEGYARQGLMPPDLQVSQLPDKDMNAAAHPCSPRLNAAGHLREHSSQELSRCVACIPPDSHASLAMQGYACLM